MTVAIGKNERGAWCVLIDGAVVSDHSTRDAAATAARRHPSRTTVHDSCPRCDGNGCEEGCGRRGGCEMVHAGPDSHKVCALCNGAGHTRRRIAAGGFEHEPWCHALHLGWTCQAWKDWKQ